MSSAESLPIIRRALDYWLAFIQELKGSPDHRLVEEHDNILRAAKLGLGAEETRCQEMQLALPAFPPIESAGLDAVVYQGLRPFRRHRSGFVRSFPGTVRPVLSAAWSVR